MSDSFPVGFYVYQLVDPRDDKPFYAGKGQRKRAWEHERGVRAGQHSSNRGKVERIQEIVAAGLAVKVQIVAVYDTELEALNHEFLLIEASPFLTNLQPGGMGQGLSQREADRRAAARLSRLRKIRDRARRMAAHSDLVRRRSAFMARAKNDQQRTEVRAWLNEAGSDAKPLLAKKQLVVERKEIAETRNRVKAQGRPTKRGKLFGRRVADRREINPADFAIYDAENW